MSQTTGGPLAPDHKSTSLGRRKVVKKIFFAIYPRGIYLRVIARVQGLIVVWPNHWRQARASSPVIWPYHN